MEFKELSQYALGIRDAYSVQAKAQGTLPWSVREHMEGFVGDVGDLIKLVMAKNGLRDYPDLDQKFAHELADCLYSVMVIADELHLDIEHAFLNTMKELAERIRQQKNK